MNKFKVGDQVRFLSNAGWVYARVSKDTPYTATDPYPIQIKIFPNQETWNGNGDTLHYTTDGRFMRGADITLQLVKEQDVAPSSRQDEEKAWLQVVSARVVRGQDAVSACKAADEMIAGYRKRFGQEEKG